MKPPKQAVRVGVREFRDNLSTYLESTAPVTITRHGATIGIFIPMRPKPTAEDLEALRAAGEKMQTLIAEAGSTEDEIVADLRQIGRARRARKA